MRELTNNINACRKLFNFNAHDDSMNVHIANPNNLS